jgi:AcrR family transcriptional regulator
MTAPPRRPTKEDAFRLARRTFLDGRRLDMPALAAELGVNRATLYRWVGSRERLLSDVLWGLSTRFFEVTLGRLRPRAGSRVPVLLTAFMEHVLAHPGARRFLDEEADVALRLVTLAGGGFQPRFVAFVRDLLAEDVAAGRLITTVPLDDLAFTAVRIVESYVHLRSITGETPDADRGGRVLAALFG